MSFFEERLPDCYSFGARGGPAFSTEVVKTVGGQRFANANWLMPLHLYDITQGVKTQDDFEVLRQFFFNVGGRRDGFRFKDWADFRAVKQPLSSVSGSIYQMNRVYVRGVRSFTRPILKPVAETVVLTRVRAGISSTPSATVSYTTGQVTVTGHVTGDTYSWTGEFDVPVAFVNDQLEAEIVNKNLRTGLLMQWPSIQLEEIR